MKWKSLEVVILRLLAGQLSFDLSGYYQEQRERI